MTTIEMLLEFLSRQKVQAYRTGDYDKVEPKVSKDADGTDVALEKQEIGFSFDKKGKFCGIYNWKD